MSDNQGPSVEPASAVPPAAFPPPGAGPQQSPEGPTSPSKSGLTELWGTILVVGGVLITLALISFEYQMGQGQTPQAASNLIGTAGHYSAQTLFWLFGKAAFLSGPWIFLLGVFTIRRGGFSDPVSRLLALFVVMIGSALSAGLIWSTDGHPSRLVGGLISLYLGGALQYMFGYYGALIVALASFGLGVALSIRLPLPLVLESLQEGIVKRLNDFSGIFTNNIYYQPARAAAAGSVGVEAMPAREVPTSQASKGSAVPPWLEKVSLPPESESPAPPRDMSGSARASAPADADGTAPKKAPPVPAESSGPGGQPGTPKTEASGSRDQWYSRQRRLQDRLRIGESGSFFEPAGVRTTGFSTRPAPERRIDCAAGDFFSSDDLARQKTASAVIAGYFNNDETRFHFTGSPRPHQGPFRAGSVGDSATNAFRGPGLLQPHDTTLLKRNRPATARMETAFLPGAWPGTGGQTSVSPGGPDREAAPSSRGVAAESRVELPVERPVAAPDGVHNTSLNADVVEQAGDPALQSGSSIERPERLRTGHLDQLADDLDSVAEMAFDAVGPNFTADSDESLESPLRTGVLENAQSAPRQTAGETAQELHTLIPEFQPARSRYHVPVDVLNSGERISNSQIQSDIEQTTARLEQVFQDYGIPARVVHAQRGPIITLYEVKLEPGIKVARIQGINDEIKMHLEAESIRIIAPIPGKSTVGIELPNRHREPVMLREMLQGSHKNEQGLGIVLGNDINGQKVFADLTRLPHLLIAGATGSGKSVYMNAIIASLLYHYSPEDLRFIMIDPKMVELRLFEGIPHLTMPVITDVRKANKALNWVVQEMERRYEILSAIKSRDLRSYNERVQQSQRQDPDSLLKPMPYIVVLIDELADLMMVSAKEVEDSIIRLTQKARAVGIHVIMATQRPSVDVITALIKANCPARIAFQVSQKTDSRTILDMNGAETLLGKGDMLYRSPIATGMIRLQAPLIGEAEIARMVAESRRYGEPVYVQLESDSTESGGGEDDSLDEQLFDQAWEIILESGKTSTSYVQRRLRIGYNRAANIIEKMEERGYLGPQMGSKPREILKRP
ncbi:MAG: DNA translocase FtsK [Leptospiraceae bacterium]|nr:DNA translocase FtsK [Leptospiraceae bacterium]